MKLMWTENAWADFEFWCDSDVRTAEKIRDLIKETKRTPFKGKGKPEPLKGDLAGFWSRRITGDHRFVYRVSGSGADQKIEVLTCRYHYTKK